MNAQAKRETLAERVKRVIDSAQEGGATLVAFSLYAGTALVGSAANKTTTPLHLELPKGVAVRQKVNEEGRCIFCEYIYADGSFLEYRYQPNNYTFTLSTKPPRVKL